MINKLRLQPLLRMVLRSQFAKIKFPLPDLGQKIKQGTVKKLYVAEGDKVNQFQKIADVQSDKQFTQITAPEVGIISKIYYKQTQVCKVGDLFLQIQTQGTQSHEKVEKKQQKVEIKLPQRKQQAKTQTKSYEDILASPVVKMFAKQRNVDLLHIKGSGKKGRILKQDIINYMQNKQTNNVKQNKPIQVQQNQQIKNYEIKKIAMNPFQKGMQKTMTQANKVPHLYLHQKMDITQLDSMREKLKSSGLKVTVMGILTKTFSLALLQNPIINSTYKTDKDQFSYTIHDYHNISLAIDTPNGLVVPNIKNVQNLSILQIQDRLSQLKKLSDSARLTRDHLQGGTICLSNIGTIAGIAACPLILVPQICIVAIGKVVQAPVFYGTSFIKKKYMTMSYGCDHRVIDGASVARFSNTWKNILQNPYLAIAKMK